MVFAGEYPPARLEELHREMRLHFPELTGLHGTITHDPYQHKPGESMTTHIRGRGGAYEGYNLYVGPQTPNTEDGLKGVIALELAHVLLGLNWLREHHSPAPRRGFCESGPSIPLLIDQSAHEGRARELCRQRGLGSLVDALAAG